MAGLPQHQGEYGFSFANVQIFRDKQLGCGSYGAVYKAKCDSLPCAAKLIYPILFTSIASQQAATLQDEEIRQPIRRFEAECHLLSQIKHPNIVQYLGVYHEPDTNVPVLLMELMDESLTHFLESSQNPVLFHLQVNILHDTALALAFLHSNGITHRDLSSNNVLLMARSRAKVTDFGMSTLTDTPHRTQCPGTPAYMSPEALDESPVYSEKLDGFSFGVLVIQVITRKFPEPTNRFQTMELAHHLTQPSLRNKALVHVSERERRQSHINLISEAHPLRTIALECIKDEDVERPTAEHLCETLEQLKSTSLYASSVQQICEKEVQIRPQMIQTTEQQFNAQELRLIIKDKDSQIQEMHKLIQEQYQHHQDQLQQLSVELELKNQHITELQRGTLSQNQLIIERRQTSANELTLKWRIGLKAPYMIHRGSSALVGNTVYINSCDSQNLYAVEGNTIPEWLLLPQCPYRNSTLAVIDNVLTTIGGHGLNYKNTTNKVISYFDHEWVELHPPMPTARCMASVLSTTTHVVVIGGSNAGKKLTVTEVLDTQTNQWSTASPLPYGIFGASITLCGDVLYLMGGDTDKESNKFSVLSCRLSDLLKSPQSTVWQNNIPNLPVKYSTCVTVQGKVLSIGGKYNLYGLRSNAVYELDTHNKQWSRKSSMNIARSGNLAIALPDDSIFVVGGYVVPDLLGGDTHDRASKTEIATVTTYLRTFQVY